MVAGRMEWMVTCLACGAAALTLVACDEDPINQRFECSIEDVILDSICLPDEDKELADEVCKHLCEQWLEDFPPGEGVVYDCSEVSVENYTGSFHTECEVDVDWEAVILEDPDSGLTRRYRCAAPWQAYDYYCAWDADGDGRVERNEGLYLTQTLFHGCGVSSTAGHQSCIDDCVEVFEQANAFLDSEGVDCGFPVALCDSLDFAYELEGQVCDAAGRMLDRAGDRAEKLVWSTADGGAATRPLACSLSGDCCQAYGPAVCTNLALDTRQAAAAEHITDIAGRVRFVAGVAGAAPVAVPFTGTVRSALRSCDNRAGTCPLYLEDIEVELPPYVLGIMLDGRRYDLISPSVTLEAPTLGVVDMRTGAVKLLGDRISLRLTATARLPDEGMSIRLDERPELPAAIDGRVADKGALSELTASVSLPGSDATVTVELHSARTPGRGVR